MATIEFNNFQGSTGLLAEQELKTALAICAGMANKEIARAFGCAPGTVKKTVERCLYKLGVANRTQLVGEAFRRGLIGHVMIVLLAITGAFGDDAKLKIRRGKLAESKIELRASARRCGIVLAA